MTTNVRVVHDEWFCCAMESQHNGGSLKWEAARTQCISVVMTKRHIQVMCFHGLERDDILGIYFLQDCFKSGVDHLPLMLDFIHDTIELFRITASSIEYRLDGQPFARAQSKISTCPNSAALAHVFSSHGQKFS